MQPGSVFMSSCPWFHGSCCLQGPFRGPYSGLTPEVMLVFMGQAATQVMQIGCPCCSPPPQDYGDIWTRGPCLGLWSYQQPVSVLTFMTSVAIKGHILIPRIRAATCSHIGIRGACSCCAHSDMSDVCCHWGMVSYGSKLQPWLCLVCGPAAIRVCIDV